MRILVIEDEKKISDVVVSRLKQEHYAVDVSYDGEDGFHKGRRKGRETEARDPDI